MRSPAPKTQQRDDNEPLIIQTCRQLGAVWTPMDATAGFDGLVSWQGVHYAVEVKNPAYAPKNMPVESMLTQNERKTKALFDSVGAPYIIVLEPLDLLRALGADFT